jgi:hypothetical protein
MRDVYQTMEIGQEMAITDKRKLSVIMAAINRIRDRASEKRWFVCRKFEGQMLVRRVDSRETMLSIINSQKTGRASTKAGEYTHSLCFNEQDVQQIIDQSRTCFTVVEQENESLQYLPGFCSIRVLKVSDKHPLCEGYPVYQGSKQLRLIVTDRSKTEGQKISCKFQTEWV